MKLIYIFKIILYLKLINEIYAQSFDEGKPLIQEIAIPKLKESKSLRLSCGLIKGELPLSFR